MKSIRNAQNELNNLKNEVIGVYKHRNIGVFELVLSVDKEKETIKTVFISQFGAIQQGFAIPYQQGILHLFPENKNMNQMLDDPFEWQAFINQFN